MAGEQHRHDISDRAWEKIKPYTIGEAGTRGGNARDTRQFINGVFWILRSGAPWRDLPETYGNWKNVHRRFCRWRDKGIWEKILEALVDDTDFEWLMIDASHVKVHPDASGARGGNQAMDRTKGGSTPRYIWPWMRMVCRCDSLSLLVPQRMLFGLHSSPLPHRRSCRIGTGSCNSFRTVVTRISISIAIVSKLRSVHSTYSCST